MHHLAHTGEDTKSTLDPTTLEDLVESFSFSEIKKRSLAAKFVAPPLSHRRKRHDIMEIGV